MSWTSTIASDTDDPQWSTTNAIWTDPDPELGSFEYSRRVNRRSAVDEDNFVAEANEKKDDWASERARLVGLQTSLDTKLNA